MTKRCTPKRLAARRRTKEYEARRDANVLLLRLEIDPQTVTDSLLDTGLILEHQVSDKTAVSAAILKYLRQGSQIRLTCDSRLCKGRVTWGPSQCPSRGYHDDS